MDTHKPIVEFDEVDDMEGMPGVCDWGDCDDPAVCFRWDDTTIPGVDGPVWVGIGYLPVCERHRTDD